MYSLLAVLNHNFVSSLCYNLSGHNPNLGKNCRLCIFDYLIVYLIIWLNSFLNVLCSLLKFDMLDTLFLINIWFISSLPWNGLSIIMNNTTNKKLFMYRLNKLKLTRKIEFYLKSLQKAEKYLEPKRASAMELLCEYT